MQLGKVRLLFQLSAALVLTLTGTAKWISALSDVAVLHTPEPISGFAYRYVLPVIGSVELCAAAVCFIRPMGRAGLVVVSCLSSAFVSYRIILWSLGWQGPCRCLGDLSDPFGVPPATVDFLLTVALAYLFVGSWCFLTTFASSAQTNDSCCLLAEANDHASSGRNIAEL